ncbi:MAG: FAD-dependent oxidoreductase [Candidatus Kapaibacteriales bacterium]
MELIQKEVITEEHDLVVVGSGIAGITSAIEAAETGVKVLLIEKQPYIGGRVVQLYKYFPKLCPPTCGIEINLKRLQNNRNVKILTLATVMAIEKKPEAVLVQIEQKPRFVNNNCTLCGECEKVCPIERVNPFNFDLDKTKAIYYPYNNAFPQKYVIDANACQFNNCRMCVEYCKYKAIDLNEKPKEIIVKTKAIIWATGWKPYEANRLSHLGFGVYPNVITNMMMERLSAPNGPTKGKLEIPKVNRKIESVAFVQCAGSRDENHLEYCSSVCCLASLKQASYIREHYPEAKIHIFYIDLRANGLLEEFYIKTQQDQNIKFHRGKVAKVFNAPSSNKLVVEAEDTLSGKLFQQEVDLVILATGMQPETYNDGKVINGYLDENGFFRNDISDWLIGCGSCVAPKDVASTVQEATGAVMKALIKIREAK